MTPRISNSLFRPASGAAVCVVCRQPLQRGVSAAEECCGKADCERSRQVSAALKTRRCRACGVFLDTIERLYTDQLCRDSRCRQSRLLPLAQGLLPTDGPSLMDVAVEQCTANSKQTGTAAPPPDAVLLVPHQQKPVVARTVEERTEFENALRALVTNHFALHPRPPSKLPEEDHGEILDDGTATKAAAACATCRGWCCQYGRYTLAWLNDSTFARYRFYHPEADEETLIGAYLSRIAEQSIEGSCLYHGPSGCSLPRALRSPVCNRFQCEQLVAVVQMTYRRPDATIWAAATDGRTIEAVGMVQQAARKNPAPAGNDNGLMPSDRETHRPLPSAEIPPR